MKDWNVTEIRLSVEAKQYGEDRVQYPYYVAGTYGPECGPDHFGKSFYWNLPKHSLENPRYGFDGLVVDERERQKL